jgi:hypothetical protein
MDCAAFCRLRAQIGFSCGGESEHVWKAGQEALVIGDDGGDARLLKHDLGNPDGVWIAGAAPGKISLVRREPGQQPGAELLKFGIGEHLRGASSWILSECEPSYT